MAEKQAEQIGDKFADTLLDNFVTKEEVFEYFIQNDEKLYEEDELNDA